MILNRKEMIYMGYRSQVALKTTTEGWILMKRMNDKIECDEDKPLYAMNIGKTPTGYYKIWHDSIKWYDGYGNVDNFNECLDKMTEQDIPFVFIEIGEDVDDINIRNNWTDDMPDCIEDFDVRTEIIDPDEGGYEMIMEEGKDKKYKDLFTPDDPDDLDSDHDDSELETDTLPTPTPIDYTHIKEVMFDLFDTYPDYDSIKEDLRSLESSGDISEDEYDLALEFWDEWLREWEAGDK